MTILGIETSCDETSAALLEVGPSTKLSVNKFMLLSNVTSSSVELQAKYGGIVPEIAARKQIEYIIPVLAEALRTANNKIKKSKHLGFGACNLEFVTAIAVTVGPGLAPSLQVGIDAAKTLSYSWQKPIVPVNHLEGHLLSPLLPEEKEIRNSKSETLNKFKITNYKLQKINFPAVALLVSGKHTELILVKDYGKYKLLGQTRDDAVGEAFDKAARMLGFKYPGGPAISKLAKNGNEKAYDFPRGMMKSGDYDFSFSGLKTSVLYKLKELEKTNKLISYKLKANLSASFEQAAVDVLVAKTMKAVEEYKAKTLLVGGGVAANKLLRKELQVSCQKLNVRCSLTPLAFSSDNAAMIALAGYFRHKAKGYLKPNPSLKAWEKFSAKPNLRLV